MTAKKKMSPLQLSLILHTLFSYLSLITTLPITSKPLENNPEHLTWEAWLMIDSKNPHEKTRKITPKSIFITPNLTNTTSSVTCPDGYKIDQNNQCIQIVNIDPDDELLNHLESLLGPSEGHEGDVSYDYSDYDSTAVHAGPFQLNIPLNLGFDSGDSHPDDNLKGDFDYDDRDGESDGNNSRPDQNVKPFREPTASNINTDDTLSVKPINRENQTIGTTTNHMDGVRNTEMATTTDIVPENETISLLFEEIKNNNKTEKNVDEDVSEIEMIDNGGSNDNVRMEPLKQGNENIAAELQKESFLFDVNDTTATTTTAQQTTTLLTADDDGFTTEESTSIETTTDLSTTVKTAKKKPPQTTTQKSSNKEIVVVVTPSNRDTLKVQNESNLDKITREKLEKHEEKEDAIDNIDTRNRFVYHHLGNEAPKFHLKPTTTGPLWRSQLQSSTTTDKSVLEKRINEQVKAITRIIEGNKGMKFPTASESSSIPNAQIDKRQNGFVRFPGPTSQRLMAATPETTPPADAESNPKWWYSNNWSEIESNYDRLQQHQPTPASSAASLSSTPFWRISTNRGNSKSPTEHLYEEQRFNHDPLYSVLTSKSLQHHHNNR